MTPAENAAVKVTILGSGTCVPSLQRSACSVLLETGRAVVLMDAGTGTIHRLLQAGKQIPDITHILLSHFHPDHCAELITILFASRHPALALRRAPLTIVAGSGFSDFLDRLRSAFGSWIDLPEDMMRIEEMDTTGPDHRLFADFRIDTAPVRHNPESVAFRLSSKRCAVVYSGDTEGCETLVKLAHCADLLVCEAALPDEFGTAGHLTPSAAGEIARRAQVRHLVLTHFYPACEDVDLAAQCRKSFAGPLTLAEDLQHFFLPCGA